MDDNKGLNTTSANASGYAAVSDPCATVTTQVKTVANQVRAIPTVIGAGPVFVKIPVLLAETNITIPVEATITLDRSVREIKRIKKNVYLTQSRLMPNFPTTTPATTAILFIEGFIRKNIEYATQDCNAATAQNFCGDIRHCTVEVPFSFTTVIDVLRAQPIFIPNTNPQELEFFTDKLQGCDLCTDPVLGRNPCDQSFQFTENFNEKPYVELVSAVVTEVDIHRNITSASQNCQNPTEQIFAQLTEKVVVNLTLKVLQNQQVRVQSLG